MRSLGATFDPKRNGLNFVRLLLAVTVIGWHSFPLTGHDIEYAPLRQLVGEIGVDGFFAISGFLIVSSWVRDPNWARYLRARALRILPAFWVCLLVTAFVIAPLVAGVLGGDNITYVVYNAGLRIFQEDIAGTPLGVPYEGVWNGSLWTLWWEFLCYLGVMTLGLFGMLRWRWTTTVLFGIALAAAAATTAGVVDNWYAAQGARFGLMFLAGAMVWQWKDRVLVNAWTVVGAAVVLMGSLLIPNYRLLAALPVAFLVMVAGANIRTPRLALRNDVSYGVYIYAFPAQQVVAYAGVDQVALMAVLATLLTFPLAIASWFLVEKPAMRLRARRPEPAPRVDAF
ncbi:acyltransferase family protein [Microbacterium sp. SSM24]|uniref:acyltransferase family protein n=1 Tax=Microbacterium sp. SSM24 TaxID=2991714 RepID=UPI002227276F|nr:acyltransferase [Microbacterium sp. SSM24]MCW3492761.1 acyltransferase [Microbacterium sp. SSM24]